MLQQKVQQQKVQQQKVQQQKVQQQDVLSITVPLTTILTGCGSAANHSSKALNLRVDLPLSPA